MRNRQQPSSPFKEPRAGASARATEEAWREKISRAFERMSTSNRKVASFLLEHPTEAAFMTGSQLAYHLELDPATIVRFAQSLGYPGYPELSAEIQSSVRAIFDVAHEIKEQTAGTPSAAWQNSLLRSAGTIQNIASVIVWKDARKFINILRGAQELIVVAEATDRILGEWFAQNLRLAGLRALTIDADPRVCREVVDNTLRQGDVLVGLAITSEGRGVADVLRAGTAHGARAIALATSASSPASLASEVTLTCPTGDGEGRLGSVSFAAVAESLRQALINAAQPAEE